MDDPKFTNGDIVRLIKVITPNSGPSFAIGTELFVLKVLPNAYQVEDLVTCSDDIVYEDEIELVRHAPSPIDALVARYAESIDLIIQGNLIGEGTWTGLLASMLHDYQSIKSNPDKQEVSQS
jgi:hypothetical protein